MELEFVNHASVVFSGGGLRLISDPWLEGTVFQGSWAHLAKTQFRAEDFRDVSHIWFSHEHPDHFRPPDLQGIPEAIRAELTVLYRQTLDHKVAQFCRKLGFRDVIELPPDEWVSLGDSFRVLCHPHLDDSALVIDDGEHVAVNTNDCVLDTEEKLEGLRACIGRPVDVLLTQFSYAGYVGETQAERRRQAERKYEQIALQLRQLAPKQLIPFASYVYFCHEDNFHMNDAVNKVSDIVEHFEGHPTTRTVVLYPGERWKVGEQHDSRPAIAHYHSDYEAIGSDLVRNVPVTPEALQSSAQNYHERLRKKVAYLPLLKTLRYVAPLCVWVTDHACAYALDPWSFRKRPDARMQDCGMSMSSETLDFCLTHDYGFNTTVVSGKFHVLDPGARKSFDALSSLGDAMNHGRVTWGQLFEGVRRRIARRLRPGTAR